MAKELVSPEHVPQASLRELYSCRTGPLQSFTARIMLLFKHTTKDQNITVCTSHTKQQDESAAAAPRLAALFPAVHQ